MRKSINRTTVIIVLAVFLTLSVGYALFSDTITIEGTATAQGNFDLTATCNTGVSQELVNAGFVESTDEGQQGFKNDSCIISGDSAVINVEMEQPGSARAFTVNIKNTGTIDAYLKLDSELIGPAAIFEEKFMTIELTNLSTGEVTSNSFNYSEDIDYYSENFPILDGISMLIRLSNGDLSDGVYNLNTEQPLDETVLYVDSNGRYYLKLAPNESLIVLTSVGWNSDATVQGYSSKTTITIPYDFVQKNSDMVIDPDAEPCFGGC